ncbi:glutamate--tRNA ligase, partial [Candidatus Micrarchaeota archaeon]|nr:glutamate--tRNA ligase [Candidatus Micrarchaeota archaeon]
GKVIAEFPEAKEDMKTTMAKISKTTAEISKMSKQEIESELKNYSFIEKKVEEKKLTLPNAVEGKVITRFPPEPSGYPHIGHAKASWLDFECAKNYNGKMILRFDDTNPEKESLEYVDAIRDGLKWLGISWDSESYTSDNMKMIYEYAEKALSNGILYVCTCLQGEISRNRETGKPCACRDLDANQKMERWKRMHSSYKPGEAIVRFKGDLSSLNTVMRDPAMFRIIEAEHYRQGKNYRVWPTYDFVAPIMDAHEEVTHAMRTKEYELRDELYYALISALDLRKPELVEFSRLAIKNAPVSKRLLTPLVKEGKVMGWDDPRLPTLKGLSRRGILPEALKTFVLSFGLSKVESEPGWDKLLAENRKLLEPISKHYFFVPEPVRLKIVGAKPTDCQLKSHPSKDMGMRTIHVADSVYVPKEDFDKIGDGEIFRLKDLYNVKMISKKNAEAEFAGDGMVEKKLQWVADDYVKTEIIVPNDLLNENGEYNEKSLEIIQGYAEKSITELKEGETIQFERFGFCKLDQKAEKYVFIYSC